MPVRPKKADIDRPRGWMKRHLRQWARRTGKREVAVAIIALGLGKEMVCFK